MLIIGTILRLCSLLKVNYLSIDYHSLSLTNDAYFLFHLQHCLQFHKKSCQSLCQQLGSPMLIV